MAIGKSSDVYTRTKLRTREILEGVVISIDPSIGSSSSMPGYAVYRATELLEAGTFDINPRGEVWERLRQLSFQLRRLYQRFPPDVLVYEEIPAQRHGGHATAHASLLKAVGAILSVGGPEYAVGIYPTSWKSQAREGYVKGDKEDAIEIGWVVCELAKVIVAEQQKPPRIKRPTR